MVFSRYILALTALFMLPFCAFAAAEKGVLERTGALTCLATDADTNDRQIEASRLECDLELFANDQTAKLEGTLYGKGLYLVDPGGSKAVWSILAPKRQIDPKMLEGDYDITSSFGLKFPLNNKSVLVGGSDGTIALELLTPKIDAIDPATRLTLTVTGAQ